MSSFTIEESDYASLKDKVVVVTGGSSGIGLATVQLLLSIGSLVVVGDQNELTLSDPKLTFVHTDVTSWPALVKLFDTAKATHGRIDHVFANAGIGPRADYMADQTGASGELLEPSTLTYDVNLRGMINTSYLGLHHFRQQGNPATCSIVCTASGSSFQPFSMVDYTTTKHAVLGFVRGIKQCLKRDNLPVRINGVAPGWTVTNLVPESWASKIVAEGGRIQGPDAVARSVALLFADGNRQGEMIFSAAGQYFEIEYGVLLPAVKGLLDL